MPRSRARSRSDRFLRKVSGTPSSSDFSSSGWMLPGSPDSGAGVGDNVVGMTAGAGAVLVGLLQAAGMMVSKMNAARTGMGARQRLGFRGIDEEFMACVLRAV